MKKYLILLIVCITVALSFSVVVAGGLFGGDDVTVKKVEIRHFNPDVHDGSDNFNLYTMGLEFVSNVNIDHIRSIQLENIEATFADGKVDKFDSAGFKYEISKDNNRDLKYADSLFKDDYYSFTFRLKDFALHDNLTHIKGDIVVNTTTQDNIVIGHIDNDVDMPKEKVPTGNTAKYNF